MNKAFYFVTLLCALGVASVWFLATTPPENNDRESSEIEQKEEEKARTVELVGNLLKRSIAAVPVEMPHVAMRPSTQPVQHVPRPDPISDDMTQDAWATNEQKRELTIQENRYELEREQEILSDPIAWKEKQRARENEWQLRELARLEKLQEEAPEEYEAQLQLFEEQKTEREIEFDERIQQQIDRVIEKSAHRS